MLTRSEPRGNSRRGSMLLWLVLSSLALLSIRGAVTAFRARQGRIANVQAQVQAEKARLLAIANSLALHIDGDAHEAQARARPNKDDVKAWRDAPAPVQALHALLSRAVELNDTRTPIYTLRLRDEKRAAVLAQRGAHHPDAMQFILASNPEPYWRHSYEYRPAMAAALIDGRAVATDLYHDQNGAWLSAYAPLRAMDGTIVALLEVDAREDLLFASLRSPFGPEFAIATVDLIVTVGVLACVLYLVTLPLRRLTTLAQRFSQGAYDTPLLARGFREVELLGTALDGARKQILAKLAEVEERGRGMQQVLDNVREGLVMLDFSGAPCGAPSASLQRWFGEVATGTGFADYIAPGDGNLRLQLDIGFEALRDEFLPVELVLGQMPRLLRRHEQTLQIEYHPILSPSAPGRLLVVISDVTSLLEKERLEAEQRTFQAIVERLIVDRPAFLLALPEVESLLAFLCQEDGEVRDLVEVRRKLHTLKGSSAMLGMGTISTLCHELESDLANTEADLSPADRSRLSGAWRSLKDRLSVLLDQHASPQSELSPSDHAALVAAIEAGANKGKLLRMLADLALQPVHDRLALCAAQIRMLAQRLGKGAVQVAVDSGDVRLRPERWNEFFGVFTHLARNAVDHGLEDPEERVRAGKSPGCQITLRAANRSGVLFFEISDDGRGIDWARLAATAAARGLPARSHSELVEVLFEEGVSTKDEVTEISGRGIGLGAVRAVVRRLGGKIGVRSAPGWGTTFTCAFPADNAGPSLVPSAPRPALGHGARHSMIPGPTIVGNS